jgi:hypothetical protein
MLESNDHLQPNVSSGVLDLTFAFLICRQAGSESQTYSTSVIFCQAEQKVIAPGSDWTKIPYRLQPALSWICQPSVSSFRGFRAFDPLPCRSPVCYSLSVPRGNCSGADSSSDSPASLSKSSSTAMIIFWRRGSCAAGDAAKRLRR